MTIQRGPQLPYSVVGGAEFSDAGWVVTSAKMRGSTFSVDSPRTVSTFKEILEDRPSFEILVVNTPLGYMDDESNAVRTCDLETAAILGERDATSRRSVTYGEIERFSSENSPRTEVTIAEQVAAEMAPYRQRSIFEGHAELSFRHLNGDSTLAFSHDTAAGLDERAALLEKLIPNFPELLVIASRTSPQLAVLNSMAVLWSARRVFARSAKKLPLIAEWDSRGLRMQIVY